MKKSSLSLLVIAAALVGCGTPTSSSSSLSSTSSSSSSESSVSSESSSSITETSSSSISSSSSSSVVELTMADLQNALTLPKQGNYTMLETETLEELYLIQGETTPTPVTYTNRHLYYRSDTKTRYTYNTGSIFQTQYYYKENGKTYFMYINEDGEVESFEQTYYSENPFDYITFDQFVVEDDHFALQESYLQEVGINSQGIIHMMFLLKGCLVQ